MNPEDAYGYCGQGRQIKADGTSHCMLLSGRRPTVSESIMRDAKGVNRQPDSRPVEPKATPSGLRLPTSIRRTVSLISSLIHVRVPGSISV